MTTDPQAPAPTALGHLGRRLVAAFTAVAALAIALVTVAALIGTDRGLTSQVHQQRQEFADNLAAAAAAAYARAGAWDAADLDELRAAVLGSGTQLSLTAADGTEVAVFGGGRRGMGAGMRQGADGESAAVVSSPVVVDGVRVAAIRLFYPATTVIAGRPVAWSWVLAAAVVALALALAAGLLAARSLTRPVQALIAVSRSYAAGDLSARVALRGSGELGALADAFDEAASAVQDAETQRRQMAADVAHELRTPLAALQAGLEELRDGLVPAEVDTLARLHDQSLRLARVVTDLADLSSAQASGHSLRWEPIDLAALVRQECAERAALVRAAELDLQLDAATPARVRGDRGRLHQVVGNLLENCVRHCRPGDTVTVRVDAPAAPDPSQPGLVRLTVRDTGPGIDEPDLAHVTTRFWRSSRARTGSVGSGLGLAIVAELVRAHHGRIEVTSPGHLGTVVMVELPAEPEPAPGLRPAPDGYS